MIRSLSYQCVFIVCGIIGMSCLADIDNNVSIASEQLTTSTDNNTRCTSEWKESGAKEAAGVFSKITNHVFGLVEATQEDISNLPPHVGGIVEGFLKMILHGIKRNITIENVSIEDLQNEIDIHIAEILSQRNDYKHRE